MSLSDNIKRIRLENNLTQEQLAKELGVSAQAVSKWETSETYPDGALLVPLAKALGVSLDELFGNDSVNMADISCRIIALLHKTEKKERFNVARDIGWQIERGLFNCSMEIEKKYDPDEIKNQKNSSYILNDNGFTFISNGKEPFFSVFPEPENGFGDFLKDKERLQQIFSALSHKDTMKALIYLYRKNRNYVFESAVLARDCDIAEKDISDVIEDLSLLNVIWKQTLTINNTERTLYYSQPSHDLIALFIMAREIGYKGAYCLQSCGRSTPFLKE
jgi:transcriptional regulator with XRE-family HTH domain